MDPLNAWDNFYVVVGSAAAGLTGLQFVVIALVADLERPAVETEIDAFATPTIVHFCAVLLIAAILSAPWPGLLGPAITMAICGALGTAYEWVVYRRTRRQTGYNPVFEDWLWHVLLPLASYVALFGAGALLLRTTKLAEFILGGSSLMLLFIGIHNAWDAVSFIVTTASRAREARRTDKREM